VGVVVHWLYQVAYTDILLLLASRLTAAAAAAAAAVYMYCCYLSTAGYVVSCRALKGPAHARFLAAHPANVHPSTLATLVLASLFFADKRERPTGSGTAREQAPQGHKLPVVLPSPGCPVPGPMSKGVEPSHPSGVLHGRART
jgi:hypothetical protein